MVVESVSDAVRCDCQLADGRGLVQARHQLVSSAYRLNHSPTPLHITHGKAQYLYDCTGKRYLDAINNIAHVGHANDEVNAALIQQTQVLNTNTRYLDQNLLDYIIQLRSYLPTELSHVFLVNSGSEANSLALRLCRAARPQSTEILVVDSCYLGNTTELIGISPYKWRNNPQARSSNVHVCALPVESAAAEWQNDMKQRIDQIHVAGKTLCTFVTESLLSCAGQLPLPSTYLHDAFELVRAAGGVCWLDEVQTGVGRCGTFCCFQRYQPVVVPDVLTLGKPCGNGFPIGVVVCRAEIAAAFESPGIEWFSSFGGSTLSCKIGLAVLDYVQKHRLTEHAEIVGQQLMGMLTKLRDKHACIGDVRGFGLMVGVELRTVDTKQPDASLTAFVARHMMSSGGVLVGVDGMHDEVIKIKPPLVFDVANAKTLVDALNTSIVAYQQSQRSHFTVRHAT